MFRMIGILIYKIQEKKVMEMLAQQLSFKVKCRNVDFALHAALKPNNEYRLMKLVRRLIARLALP